MKKWKLKRHILNLETLRREFLKGVYSVFKYFLSAIIIFYLANIIYGFLNKFSFEKFSDEQITQIINAQTEDETYERALVKFDPNKPPVVVVLGSSLPSNEEEANYFMDTNEPATLNIFEEVAKNPFEKILFESAIYKKKSVFELVPEWQKNDYKLIKSSLRVIDLFNDKKEEVFFCLQYLNVGSGTNLDCSIFDGQFFWKPFPAQMEGLMNEVNNWRNSVFETDYEYLEYSEDPVFSNIHSDTVFSFDEKDDTMIFLEMIWADGECHFCPHDYEIYAYKIMQNPDFIWSSEPSWFFSGGFIRTTKQNEKGKPEDVIINEFLLK